MIHGTTLKLLNTILHPDDLEKILKIIKEDIIETCEIAPPMGQISGYWYMGFNGDPIEGYIPGPTEKYIWN